jgi:ATP-binding cassette subfamily B protein
VVEFKNVTFCYSGADTPVLENISFKANPGETTAFIGSTGSGKSTLVNLIPRFHDVNSGEIFIDGIDVRQYKLEDLYAKIGYVPQKGVLFSGTVESNIRYGAPEATDAEVEKTAEIAQAKEFIDNLEDKFESPIAQGGMNVSGGQKQRLSIARAIARKPEIYIFDDSFSALDFKTDAMLRHALKTETKDKTVLVVAQRISTILSAEKIIVLDDGKIAGEGTHEQLLRDCGVYREIAYSQLSEEELKAYQIDVDRGKNKTERLESLSLSQKPI